MKDLDRPVVWQRVEAVAGYLCVADCGLPATYLKRPARHLTRQEYLLGESAGVALCKKHWGKRNG